MDYEEIVFEMDSKWQNIKIVKFREFGNVLFFDNDISKILWQIFWLFVIVQKLYDFKINLIFVKFIQKKMICQLDNVSFKIIFNVLFEFFLVFGESDLVYIEILFGIGRNEFKDKIVLILGGGDGGVFYEFFKMLFVYVFMVEVRFFIIIL